jgi:virulence-associated protein VagC
LTIPAETYNEAIIKPEKESGMKLKVTEEGLLIPKELLGESQEVELIQQEGQIIITPAPRQTSIWDLGSNPVECEVKDGAIHHDRYLYGQ